MPNRDSLYSGDGTSTRGPDDTRLIDLDAVFSQFIPIMGPRRGDFCRAPIPFTDGTGGKVRPVLVLAPQGPNLLVVPLTTHPPRDEFDVPLLPSVSGLRKQGTARCSQLLLISDTVVIELLGHALPEDFRRVLETADRWFRTTVVSLATYTAGGTL